MGMLIRLAAIAGISLITVSASIAADFYQGRQLSFLINYAPGGPADAEGRLIARHLGKHIAGTPTLVIRNMPGAGGIVGANWLGQVAAPDGLTLGFLTGVASKAAMADPNFKVDMSKFAFVAGGSGISITFIRTDVPPGLRKPEDLMRAKDFWAGGLTPDSDKDLRERMQLDMLGVPYKYISGYGNTADVRLALQRNEVQMYVESSPTYRTTIEPGLVKTGQVIPLWHDPIDDGEKLTPSADADGIDAQTFDQFLIRMKGELPKGVMWDSFRRVNQVGTAFLRLFVMPPGTPPEAVEAIKVGLQKMSADLEFRAEAQRMMSYVPTYIVSDRAERLYRSVLSPDREFLGFMHAYIGSGTASSGRK